MAHSTDYDYLVKIVIVGESGVGKTSLLHRYKENEFRGCHIATIGVDFEVKTVMFGERVVKLQMWDTAGQERFRNITTTYYRGAHCVVLVVDVTAPAEETRVSVGRWITEIKRFTTEDAQILLVANKADMSRHRRISFQELQVVAAEHKISLVETSAKSSEGVKMAFENTAKNYIDRCLAKKVTVAKDEFKLPGFFSLTGRTRLPTEPATSNPLLDCCVTQ